MQYNAKKVDLTETFVLELNEKAKKSTSLTVTAKPEQMMMPAGCKGSDEVQYHAQTLLTDGCESNSSRPCSLLAGPAAPHFLMPRWTDTALLSLADGPARLPIAPRPQIRTVFRHRCAATAGMSILPGIKYRKHKVAENMEFGVHRFTLKCDPQPTFTTSIKTGPIGTAFWERLPVSPYP